MRAERPRAQGGAASRQGCARWEEVEVTAQQQHTPPGKGCCLGSGQFSESHAATACNLERPVWTTSAAPSSPSKRCSLPSFSKQLTLSGMKSWARRGSPYR